MPSRTQPRKATPPGHSTAAAADMKYCVPAAARRGAWDLPAPFRTSTTSAAPPTSSSAATGK